MINYRKQKIIFSIKLKKYKKIANKNNIKKIILISIFFILLIEILNNKKIGIKNIFELNRKYSEIQKYINFTFPNKLKSKIRLGIYIYKLKGGGIERATTLLLNYIHNIKIFDIFLFTLNIIEVDEYDIPDNIKRVFLKDENINNLIVETKKKKINILLPQI